MQYCQTSSTVPLSTLAKVSYSGGQQSEPWVDVSAVFLKAVLAATIANVFTHKRASHCTLSRADSGLRPLLLWLPTVLACGCLRSCCCATESFWRFASGSYEPAVRCEQPLPPACVDHSVSVTTELRVLSLEQYQHLPCSSCPWACQQGGQQ